MFKRGGRVMNMATVKKDPVRFVRELQDDLNRAFCLTFMNYSRLNLFRPEMQEDIAPMKGQGKESL
jgi:hypothetical protein